MPLTVPRLSIANSAIFKKSFKRPETHSILTVAKSVRSDRFCNGGNFNNFTEMMQGLTPKFNALLDDILKNLEPGQRTCQNCRQPFEIFKEDIEFYKMLMAPPPKECPTCRQEKRCALYPRLYDFFKKPCSAPGHTEQVISIYTAENPIKVYDLDFWHSDFWDPSSFQKEIVPEKFSEQFRELAFETPHPAGVRGARLVNCQYTIGGLDSRDCYYATTPASSEGIYYSFIVFGKDCLDCSDSEEIELCYEAVDAKNCYNCSFLQDCENCLDSDFLYDCRNCSHCFASANLRNKQYYFFNQPCSKKEYFEKRKKINLGNCQILEQTKDRFEKQILKSALKRNIRTKNTIRSLGDKIENCKDCYYVFNGYKQNNENIRYCDELQYLKDSADVTGASFSSYVYNTAAVIRCSRVKLCFWVINSSEIEYSMFCDNCQRCFGCFGLKNKEYCILNKQYSKEEYWRLVDEIKSDLLKKGQYGEFFDPKVFRFYPYNNTMAFLSFPKTKEEAEKQGYLWAEREKWDKEAKGPDPNVFFAPEDLPQDIKDVKDDILDKVIVCEASKRPFKIVARELDFYRKKGLPLPARHPYQRLIDRHQRQHRNRYHLYPFICPECHQATYTTYSQKAQKEYNIICEKCYLQKVV